MNQSQRNNGTSKVIAAIASATDKPFQVAFKATLGVALAQLTVMVIVALGVSLLILAGILAYKFL